MESTFEALNGLLLTALPTFFLLLFLHFYLRSVFFGPMEKVLKARHDATEGARQSAEASLAAAAAKAAEYEAAIRQAMSDIHQEQETLRRDLQEQRAGIVRAARMGADAIVSDAKAELARELADAKRLIEAESGEVADRIADAVLNARRAA